MGQVGLGSQKEAGVVTMTGCHNCETADLIAAGQYVDVLWEDIPCATCEVMTGNSHAMEYDENRETPDDDQSAPQRAEEEQEEFVPLDMMTDTMVAFLQLRTEVRDVIAWRLAGMKYPDIALLQEVTTACVEKRHRTAMQSWPALQALFPRKVAKQRTRKPHTRRDKE